MRDILGPGAILGYCTNVHAGRDLATMRSNLQQHAVAVRRRLGLASGEPMGVGLWFSAAAARQLIEQNQVQELRDWLGEHGLLAYTLNGFPHGDFHEPAVKHRVYEPDWTTPARLDYTRDLIQILAGLLPDDAVEGSISTLPIGWPRDGYGPHWETERGRLAGAARQLTDLVHTLARVELDTGKLIHIDLEPEPGCVLSTSADIVRFFENHLLGTLDDESVRAYLRVCHDICHSAVMFEPQAEALVTYRKAGLRVGKVQVSSAVTADLAARPEAWEELARFREPRYLHQTNVRHKDEIQFFEDLPDAMQRLGAMGAWRVHFHVPIYLASIGSLGTTQADIRVLLGALRSEDEVHHFEVETYAWSVLPEELQRGELSEGIAEELRWLRGVAA